MHRRNQRATRYAVRAVYHGDRVYLKPCSERGHLNQIVTDPEPIVHGPVLDDVYRTALADEDLRQVEIVELIT